MRLDFFVPGQVIPQGSLRPVVSKSTGQAFIKNNPQVIAWRMKVTGHARQAVQMSGGPFFPLNTPIGVTLSFALERPAFHWGTGKNATSLKASAPAHPIKPPDIDKLVRAILDALTDAQVWLDDAQVIWVQASKHWCAPNEQAGVHVMLGPIRSQPNGQ